MDPSSHSGPDLQPFSKVLDPACDIRLEQRSARASDCLRQFGSGSVGLRVTFQPTGPSILSAKSLYSTVSNVLQQRYSGPQVY